MKYGTMTTAQLIAALVDEKIEADRANHSTDDDYYDHVDHSIFIMEELEKRLGGLA